MKNFDGVFTVYEIICETPNHRYVGQTGQIENRITAHMEGRGAKFTQRHGFDSWRVIKAVATRTAAKAVERAHYYKLKNQGFTIRM